MPRSWMKSWTAPSRSPAARGRIRANSAVAARVACRRLIVGCGSTAITRPVGPTRLAARVENTPRLAPRSTHLPGASAKPGSPRSPPANDGIERVEPVAGQVERQPSGVRLRPDCGKPGDLSQFSAQVPGRRGGRGLKMEKASGSRGGSRVSAADARVEAVVRADVIPQAIVRAWVDLGDSNAYDGAAASPFRRARRMRVGLKSEKIA